MENSLYKQKTKTNQVMFQSEKEKHIHFDVCWNKSKMLKYAHQDPLAWFRCSLLGWWPSSSTLANAWAEALCPLDESCCRWLPCQWTQQRGMCTEIVVPGEETHIRTYRCIHVIHGALQLVSRTAHPFTPTETFNCVGLHSPSLAGVQQQWPLTLYYSIS